MRLRPVQARWLFPFSVVGMGTMPYLFPLVVSSVSSFVASSCVGRLVSRSGVRPVGSRFGHRCVVVPSPRRAAAVASPSCFSFRIPLCGVRPRLVFHPVVRAVRRCSFVDASGGESTVFGSSPYLPTFVNRACLSTFYILSTFCIFCSLSIFYILRYTIQ